MTHCFRGKSSIHIQSAQDAHRSSSSRSERGMGIGEGVKRDGELTRNWGTRKCSEERSCLQYGDDVGRDFIDPLLVFHTIFVDQAEGRQEVVGANDTSTNAAVNRGNRISVTRK